MNKTPKSPDNSKRDLSNFKLAQDLLPASEIRYRLLFETTHDGILIVDADTGHIVDINPFLINLIGYSRKHFLGREIWDIGIFKEFIANKDEFEELQKKRFLRCEDVPVKTADGEEIAVEFVCNFYSDNNTEFIQFNIRDNTGHRLTEEALKESEKRYKNLYESSRDAIMTLEPPSWKFTSGNPATVKMFMAKDETEFTSSEPWSLSPQYQPDGQKSGKKALEMINTAMQNGVHFFEWTHKRLNGEDFPATVLLSKMELFGREFLQATVRDITEQKQAEEKLKESKEIFRIVFENANDAILLVEISEDGEPGKFFEVNETACRRMKYTRDEFLRLSVKDIDAPETWEKIRENVKNLVINGSATFEGVHITKDGERVPVEISAHTINFQGHNMILSHVRDITERKQAEDKLKKTEKEFRSLISNSADIIAVLDTQGNSLFLSASFYTILGYRYKKPGIKKVLELIHPDDIQKALNTIKSAEKHPGQNHSIELRIKNADGSWRILEVIGKMSSWGSYERAIIINARDITQRKQAEDQIRTLYEELTEESIALNQTQNELHFLNNQLEEKVSERTSELEQVNLMLTERNLTLRIINAGARALLVVQDEAGFIPQICNELVRTGEYSYVWLAGIDAEGKIGIAATAGDKYPEFSKMLAGGQLPACTDPILKTGGVKMIVTPDPACADCPLSRVHADQSTIVVRLDAGEKTVGVLGVTLRPKILPAEQETERVGQIAQEIAFVILYLRIKELEQKAYNQITKNLEQLAILNDQIRNPLQGIVGYAGMGEGELFEKIIELSDKIDSIVTKLDEGYLESKKIRNFMELHEHIKIQPDMRTDAP